MALTQARKEANERYLGKLDEIKVRMPKGKKEVVRTHAEKKDGSLNGFINRAIDEAIERDNRR